MKKQLILKLKGTHFMIFPTENNANLSFCVLPFSYSAHLVFSHTYSHHTLYEIALRSLSSQCVHNRTATNTLTFCNDIELHSQIRYHKFSIHVNDEVLK